VPTGRTILTGPKTRVRTLTAGGFASSSLEVGGRAGLAGHPRGRVPVRVLAQIRGC